MTDTCWHCGEPVADEDYAQEEVVELPTGDGWAAVHANGCPKERLPKLVEEYREAKALLDYAQGGWIGSRQLSTKPLVPRSSWC